MELYLKILHTRSLALEIGTPGHSVPFNIYTGFVIEIEGLWFWFTAAHCKKLIGGALESGFPSLVRFLTFTDGGHLVPLPVEMVEFVDFQEITKSQIVSSGLPLEDNLRNIELLDVACMQIREPYASYLRNFDVEAFSISDMSEDFSMYDLQDNVHTAYFVAGVPAQSIDHTNLEVECSLRIFPLHPGAEDDISRETIKFEGAYAWIPTYWRQDDSNNDLSGVSGGPVVVVFEEHDVRLAGIQTMQRSRGRKVISIGCCPISPIAERLADCIRNWPQEKSEAELENEL